MEDCVFDIISGRVSLNGADFHLTGTEARLFRELFRRAGEAVEYHTLVAAVWGEACRGEIKYLQDYIRLLRKKLEPDPKNPVHILNIRGYGYQLNLPLIKP